MTRARERPTGYVPDRGILFDTSVIVAALLDAHPHHQLALPWMMRVLSDEISLYLASHSLAEIYSAMTTIPVTPRITPAQARQLIDEVVVRLCRARIISLTSTEYLAAIDVVNRQNLRGGVIHDAVIAQCAHKAKVSLLTFNRRDFARVAEPTTEIIAP